MSRAGDIFERLTEIIEQENVALRRGRHDLILELNERKQRAYLECFSVLARIKSAENDPEFGQHLEELRSRLALNKSLLQLHLDALNEITRTLAEVICDADSDGTYSATSHK